MKAARITSFLVLVTALCLAAEMTVGRFSAGDLSGWEDQTFKGKKKSVYTIVRDGDRTVLKAESRNAASGLLKKVNVDPKINRILRWSWKVAGTIKKGDERSKEGDDYAARVYVVFPRMLFWRTRAINYIWANRLPKGASAPNAYTANVMMVAVESGNDLAGKWVNEERNIYEDYVKLFGEEPPMLGGVALMTDTDNTGGEATAWYGDILLANR